MRNDITLIKESLCRYSLLEAEATHRALQSLDPPSPEFFTELDRRVAEIKKVEGGTLTFKKAITALIAATLIIAVLAVTAYAISEKINIGGFFVEWFEDHLKLSTADELDESISAENVVIGYLPHDFTVLINDISKQEGFCKWEHGDSNILLEFFIADANDDYFLSNENNHCMVLTIGEKVVYRTEYPTQVSVLWSDEKMVYYLSCVNLEWDEMVKIIEGISYAAE